MDNFYLNNGVYHFEEMLKRLAPDDPDAFEVLYGDRAGAGHPTPALNCLRACRLHEKCLSVDVCHCWVVRALLEWGLLQPKLDFATPIQLDGKSTVHATD